MAAAKRAFLEWQHPRDSRGRFARKGSEAWVKRSADMFKAASSSPRVGSRTTAPDRPRIGRNAKAAKLFATHNGLDTGLSRPYAPKVAVAAPAEPFAKPTATPTRMTKGQYTKLLKEEHVRLQVLDGRSEKEAKAAARPAATIDDLKARNVELRNRLRAKGIDYRTDEQKRADDAEKVSLLDEVERLAVAGGYDGPAKRAAAARMTAPELRKFIADTKQYQQRQAEKARAAREGAAAQAAFEQRQATLTATPRQVDYILNLLARRRRSGDGGGFFSGPTDRAGIAKLSRADASAYINSLTGNY
ncbi:hypothetical protein Drose_04240 [Dactylosporangium roseum]|uniref:Uncharacterized protein n=1 Tax=Dactylosporangium roseum TaxID=47989 RepID=A0ABY5ZAV2_9ACTN|nr:hypothetical protein [Dactylosporangium roseum]UWZ37499.1 hypothetical protein Drose_04240 [Dactylosporangium roseum]